MSTRTASQARRSRKPARLSLECLERREVKAGNVQAWVDASGTLNVVGDGASNGVQITQVSSTSYTVSGLYQYGATGINGFSSRTFSNVRTDIAVNLGNGDDYLAIGGTTAGGRARLDDDLRIVMGAGHDTVDIWALTNRDDNDYMSIDTGSGDDRVNLFNVSCNAGLEVKTGSGNDRLTMGNSAAGWMYADLGTGNDQADVRNSWFASLSAVEGGSGFDTGLFRSNSSTLRVRGFESFR
ncbi:MAG: hypothetical protein ACKOSQ_00370 [Planctomycetaceae bacterium]